MSHDGLPVRAAGAHAAVADRRVDTTRRRHRTRIAALGAIATLALAACGGSASSSPAGASGTPGSSIATASEMPSASVEPSASGSAQATINFQEANASKIFGGGLLTDLGDGSTAATIGVVAIGFDEPMPAEIVAGDCATIIAAPAPSVSAASPSAAASVAPSVAASAEPSVAPSVGPSVAPTPATLPIELTPVSAGSSNTVIQISLADLLATPTAVVLEKSATDPTVVACADVTNAPLPIPSDLPSLLPSSLPSLPPLPSAS
jgi:hypothetical protein